MIRVTEMQTLIPSSLLAGLSGDVLDQILDDIADSARGYWMNLASKDPSSFRGDYTNGIQPVERQPGKAIIALVGEIAHMLEDGSPRLDLRDTLLGPNVPVVPRGESGKHLVENGDGPGMYYRAIPFRHTTPGTGKGTGQAMGSAYAGHEGVPSAKKLGKEIYSEAKKLNPTMTTEGGNVYHMEGGKPKKGYGGRLKAGMAPKLSAHHKTDIYAGMIKETKTYEKATQAKYFTFRTISTSVKSGWIRGPITARKYADKVSAFVAKLATSSVEALLEG